MSSGPIKIGDALQGVSGLITSKKYKHLKQFYNSLSDEEKLQVDEYEKAQNQNVNINKIPESKPKELITKLPGEYVFNFYKIFWKNVQQKELIITDFNKKILIALCQYFGKDEKCPLDLKKGILLSGDCGIGKTSMMMTFYAMGKHLIEKRQDPFMWFRTMNCNEIVTEFEGITDEDDDVKQFHNRMKKGDFYFDDFGTERDASRYGKSNLMREIIENRYLDLTCKTYITTNLNSDEILQRYGKRVFDRLFEQFNYIEMQGESFRRIT